MSNPAFKDVRNLKKTSITTTFLNLGKENVKYEGSQSQKVLMPR